VTGLPVPRTVAELLTPDWLTAALRRRFPGVEVTRVEPGPIVERVSTNVRFTIDTAGPLPDGLPAHLCVKGYFAEEGRSIPGVGAVEATFYRDLAPHAGARTLHAVYADIDPETHHGVVVSADVVEAGGGFLDALSPYTADQVAESLEQYARLHSFTWTHAEWHGHDWLKPPRASFMQARGLPDIERNFDGPNGAGVPVEVRDAPRLLDAFAALVADTSGQAEWPVIHGDAHVGNVFLDAEQRPSLLDWQMVSYGPWGLDVGYHIASALPVDERRRTERDLLQHYLDQLKAGGAEPPAWDTAWQEYRRGIVYGYYLWGITRLVDAPVIAELLTRLGSAADDHDSFGAVGA
jgi:Phosphotransferase enzyme family